MPTKRLETKLWYKSIGTSKSLLEGAKHSFLRGFFFFCFVFLRFFSFVFFFWFSVEFKQLKIWNGKTRL